MTRQIFRKAALNRLASPDQLDQLMQVTSPRSWIALGGFGLVLLAALLWSWFGSIATTVDGSGVLLRGSGLKPLLAPCDGVVTKFLSKSGEAGEDVTKGQPLVRLTPTAVDKTPLEVVSPFAGRMLNRSAKEGEPVKKGSPLLMLESLERPLYARLYLPVSEGYQVRPGMLVHVWPANVKKNEFGYMNGHVIVAARFPITRLELADTLQNDDLAGELTAGGPKLQIIVKLTTDPNTKSRFQWSISEGPQFQLFSGTPCQGRIIISEHRPIHLVFTGLGN